MGILKDIFGQYIGLGLDDDFGDVVIDAPPKSVKRPGPKPLTPRQLQEESRPWPAPWVRSWGTPVRTKGSVNRPLLDDITYELCDCGSKWCACGRPFSSLGCACGYCSCGKKRVSTAKQKLDNKKNLGDNSIMTLKSTEMLDKAISITAQAFLGKTDKSGIPYILHCLHVMGEIRKQFPKDWELQAIAVLHDLVEDTEWTLEMLRDEGFSHRIVRGVEVLTHDSEVPYDDYIKHIGMYEDARHVKLKDLRHNSDIMRIKGLTQRDLNRIDKYHRSYTYLSKK